MRFHQQLDEALRQSLEDLFSRFEIRPWRGLFEGCDHFWRRTSRTNTNSAYEHRVVTLFESFRNPAGHLANLPLIPIAIWSEQFNNPHVLGDGP